MFNNKNPFWDAVEHSIKKLFPIILEKYYIFPHKKTVPCQKD